MCCKRKDRQPRLWGRRCNWGQPAVVQAPVATGTAPSYGRPGVATESIAGPSSSSPPPYEKAVGGGTGSMAGAGTDTTTATSLLMTPTSSVAGGPPGSGTTATHDFNLASGSGSGLSGTDTAVIQLTVPRQDVDRLVRALDGAGMGVEKTIRGAAQ